MSAYIWPQTPARRTKYGKAVGGAANGGSEFICSHALANVSIRADDSSIAAADKSSKVTKSTEIFRDAKIFIKIRFK